MTEFDPSLPLKNAKWEMFAQSYVLYLNGVQAYQAVYPKNKKPQVAKVNASQLLAKEEIRARYEYLLKQRSQRVEGSGDDVLKLLREGIKINYADWFEYGEIGISKEKFESMPREVQMLLTNPPVSTKKETTDKDGKVIKTEYRVIPKFISREYLIDKLGSHEGLWNDNNKIKIPGIDELINKLDKEGK